MTPYWRGENHMRLTNPAPTKPKAAPAATSTWAATSQARPPAQAKQKIPAVSRAQALGRMRRAPTRSSSAPETSWVTAKPQV